MVGPEREERLVYPELLTHCKGRYDKWVEELLLPFEAESPPRLVTPEFYEVLTANISPKIRESLGLLSYSIEELIESQPTVSERNSVRERVIRDVAGEDVLAGISDEKVRRRVRAITTDLLVALQSSDLGASTLEAKLAPRAWHWVKDCDLRGLQDISSITHLDTEKGEKIASTSPRELAYTVHLLSN